MSSNVFLDMGIFICAYSEDQNKRNRSFELMNNFPCITSTQILNEFSDVCFRELKLPDKTVSMAIEEMMDFCDVFIVNELTIQRAIFIKGHYGYSYRGSLVLASALECECSILYSEDLPNGQIIEGSLRIVNPFV